jgi:hypothetical protein
MDNNNGRIAIPYVKGTSERISKILKRFQIETAFRPHQKIKQFVPPIKDKHNLMVGPGVYKIPCECGSCYIGQTKRPINVRTNKIFASIPI